MILTEEQQKYQYENQYEYLTEKEILTSNQSQIIEQTEFTFSPLGKTLEKQIGAAVEKQTKSIEDRVEKQILNTDQSISC